MSADRARNDGPQERASRPLRVLVVDDSATVREVLQRALGGDGSMSVMVASDPIIAMHKMERTRPDVILLDLTMPRMDGLAFLRKLMREDPIPVVVCSALEGGAAEAALRALDEGAIDVVAKPRLGVKTFLEDSVTRLADVLRGAASARRPAMKPVRSSFEAQRRSAALLPARPALSEGRRERIIALGASTGGTEALRTILEALPEDAPGVVVVQHMPGGFTAAFADRLRQSCRIEVREAKPDDRVRRGLALIAPGDHHLCVRRAALGYAVDVVGGPLVTRHRPSVDVLFQSVAEAAGPSAVAALLTGMGEDGARGLLELKERGAWTIAQDEATCVVFGMPKEAISRGAALDVVALPNIAAVLLDRAMRTQRARSSPGGTPRGGRP